MPEKIGSDGTGDPARGPLWAVGGLVVGAVLVFAALRGRSEPTAPPVLSPQAAVAVKDSTPPTVQEPAESEKQPPATADDPSPTEGAEGDAQQQPAEPQPLPKPPSEITGAIGASPGGTSPFLPPSPDVSLRAPEVRLVRLNVYSSASDTALSQLEAHAKKMGAKVRTFVDYPNADAEPSEGLLILIPEKQVDDLVKFVHQKNSNVAEQNWTISPEARQMRLKDEVHATLFELKAKRQRLLVKYLEDAGPVKDVEDAIDQVEKSLATLHVEDSARELAAVKITFGSRG